MLTNYIKTALRNIFRYKSYVLINILGLAVGFACSILIFSFVFYELNFDRFNEKYDRIYRLYLEGRLNESEFKGAWTAAPTARVFLEELPEIEAAIRMTSYDETLVRIDDRKFIETKIALADSSFFDIFSISLITGNPKEALASPNAVVLTKSQAEKYFGDDMPVGKHLRLGNDTVLYRITGIMEDVPENSHFDFNMLISFLSHSRAHDNMWLSNSFATYLLIKEGTDPAVIEDKIPGIIEKYVGPQVEEILGLDLEAFVEAGNVYGLHLQPLSDIHMNTDIDSDFKRPTDRKYIFIFSVVGVLILIVASINYMNLASARSIRRSREVGLRKVVGSTHGQLIRQFLMESVVLSLISAAIGVMIVELVLPFVNNMLEIQLSIQYFSKWYIIPALLLLVIIIGVVSGSYPAFFISSFVPVSALYGKLKFGMSNIRLRSSLVVLQFAISIFLVLSSLIIYRQIDYMVHKDLGFDQEQLLVIRRANGLRNQIRPFLEEVNKISGVISSCNSTSIPGYPNNNSAFMVEGRPAEDLHMFWMAWVDFDFIKTYKMNISTGRDFNKEYTSDSLAAIINKKAAENYHFDDPFSIRLIQPGWTEDERLFHNIIGVVDNFHFQSLRETIEPHVFLIKPASMDWAGYITIRIDIAQTDKAIRQIEQQWKDFTGDEPFQYFFLDQEFEKFYKEEKRTGRIAVAFSILSIFIASLGLYGLTSFSTEQRAREISLRKVVGASAASIIRLFAREISLLVVIATIPSWLIAYYMMQKWLENFYYRVAIGPWEFIVAFVVTLIISIITVSYRTYRAAVTNPADVLKYE